jgi:hypothetical protein
MERTKRRFDVLLARDPAAFGLVERAQLVRSRRVDARAPRLDLARDLGECFLVLFRPRTLPAQ